MSNAQGHRGLLRRGVVVDRTMAPGRVPVSRAGLTTAALVVASKCAARGDISQAELEDELQEALIRLWLSGDGVWENTRAAASELSRIACRKIGNSNRSWTLARYRRELRTGNAHRLVMTNGAENEVCLFDLLECSQPSADDIADVRKIVAAAGEFEGRTHDGRTAADRTPVILAAMADEITGADAARMLGVTPSAVVSLKARMRTYLRGRFNDSEKRM